MYDNICYVILTWRYELCDLMVELSLDIKRYRNMFAKDICLYDFHNFENRFLHTYFSCLFVLIYKIRFSENNSLYVSGLKFGFSRKYGVWIFFTYLTWTVLSFCFSIRIWTYVPIISLLNVFFNLFWSSEKPNYKIW